MVQPAYHREPSEALRRSLAGGMLAPLLALQERKLGGCELDVHLRAGDEVRPTLVAKFRPAPTRKENLTLFLTLEDPNAKIKGSRDPLGVQPIWARFGREVVTNLTMQTNSTRGFTILLLARYLTERLIEDGRLDRELALDAFLRFEQIGAYVRHAAHEVGGDIRGIERVRSRLGEHRGRVPIRADPDGFILGDQKVNGLWGLFSVSARVSGLVPDGPVGLTPEASAFVERAYLPELRPIMEPMLRLVAQDGRLDTRKPDAIFSTLSKVLPEEFTGEEQRFYGEHLRDGLHVKNARSGLQRRFRELLVDCVDLDSATDRSEIVQLCEAARSVDDELAIRLDRIARMEAVLAPAMSLFDFMLTLHHRELDEAADELTNRWGTSVPNIDAVMNRDLLPDIDSVSSDRVCGCFDRCQQGLAGGHYREALSALLEWHKSVMNSRGGASWVEIGGTESWTCGTGERSRACRPGMTSRRCGGTDTSSRP